MKKKNLYVHIGLSVFVLILIWLIMPKGALFGSKVDWLSQHTAIPEYFRTQFYESGNLFPDFAPALGAGQNIYNFSYYGLLRPDVLISYALPFIQMVDIISIYMMISLVATVNLCYAWLQHHKLDHDVTIIASILFICSAPLLFHAHRQIMFVNYMPWLLLALYATDLYIERGKKNLLIFSIFMIILHSYFFSVGAIAICGIYFCFRTEFQFKKAHLLSLLRYGSYVMIAILMGAILLVPTAIALTQQARGSVAISQASLLIPNLGLKSLLYSAYGTGMSAIAWVCLWLQISNRRNRKLACFLLIVFILPFFEYLFNGTLYVRSKSLIVFLPLLAYLIADTIQQWKQKELKFHWQLIPIFILWFFVEEKNIYMIDVVSVCAILFLYSHFKKKKILLLLMVAPLLCSYFVNQSELFVDKKSYASTENKERDMLIEKHLKGSQGRLEDLSSPLNTSNRVSHPDVKKSTYYSSVHNQDYNDFYNNVLRNPISIRNRVALLANPNIFTHGMMASEYLYTKKSIPYGYRKVEGTHKGSLVKSEKVLPMAYATSQIMGEAQYKTLDYPYNLDTIYNNVIVPKEKESRYQSEMKEIPFDYNIKKQSKHLTVKKVEDGYRIHAERKSKLVLEPKIKQKNQILLLSFDVEEVEKGKTRDTLISINKVGNKLSKEQAPYPNENQRFHYTFSSDEDLASLSIAFSKGAYSLKNIKVYTLDYNVIQNRRQEVDPLIQKKNVSNVVLSGSIDVQEDGYFVTSIPYQKGIEMFIDGKKVSHEKINTAFVGAPINAGEHKVIVKFNAPGKLLGMVLSLTGIALWIGVNIIRKRKQNG